MSARRPDGVSGGTHRVVRAIATTELAGQAAALLTAGFRLALVAAHDDGPLLRVVYLFLAGPPDRRVELQVELSADDPRVPSLADQSFPAGRFEREMADLYGITPVGHPAPRRLVRHAHWPEDWHPMRRDAVTPAEFDDDDSFPFVTVDGTGVYEIPVGPVHAGLIEPGHFRFSVVGETILKLKARLWFTHRGIEKLYEGRGATDAVGLAERISGDTAAAHALAHSLAVEDALGITMPDPAHRLRALLVELERLYNHATDLGALANDVGYGLANIHAQHIREQLLRLNDTVTGHRLLRDGIRPGAVALHALPDPHQLRSIADDLADITELTLANTVVRDRFTGTAPLTRDQAHDLGCLGYAARATGLAVDARLDHPTVALPVHPVLGTSGDVLARYTTRRDEFGASVDLACRLIEECDGALSISTSSADTSPARSRPAPVRSGIGIVEGWRGTIVHRVEIDPDNRITRSKIVDPSWFNWPAVAVAMTNTIVPDFPLVNKSFNLSYAGNDL
jgi:Ni,Fe-hydrogenase III large subunit/Ni,Fe-hydrogenase III component G